MMASRSPGVRTGSEVGCSLVLALTALLSRLRSARSFSSFARISSRCSACEIVMLGQSQQHGGSNDPNRAVGTHNMHYRELSARQARRSQCLFFLPVMFVITEL